MMMMMICHDAELHEKLVRIIEEIWNTVQIDQVWHTLQYKSQQLKTFRICNHSHYDRRHSKFIIRESLQRLKFYSFLPINLTENTSVVNEFSNPKEKLDNSLTNSAMVQQNYASMNNHQSSDFQNGDFIISRQDVFVDWPPIWRVDSKTLLQKFEPFHSNNKTIYRSLSTVSTIRMKFNQLQNIH